MTRRGSAKEDGSPSDVNNEVFTMFAEIELNVHLEAGMVARFRLP